MAYYFFVFIFSLTFLVTLFLKRGFDLITIFSFASIFYLYPLIIGHVDNPSSFGIIEIPKGAYYFFNVYFIFVIVSLFIPFQNAIYSQDFCAFKSIDFKILLIIQTALLLLIIAIYPDIFLPSNIDNPSQPSRLGLIYPFFTTFALVLFAVSLHSKNKIKISIATVPILLTLTAGSRLYVALALLIYFLYHFNSRGKFRIALDLSSGIKLFLMVFFLLVFKIAYQYLLEGDWSNLISALLEPNNYIYRLLRGSESNAVVLNFISVFQPQIMQDDSYLYFFFIGLIPFLKRFILSITNDVHVSFGDFIQDALFSDVGYGLASSFWGQMLYVFDGLPFAFIPLILYFIFLVFINRFYLSGKKLSFFLLPSFCISIFYYHRWGLGSLIYVFSVNFIAYLLFVAFKQLLIQKGKGP